jgi:hypothetical protein
VIPWCNLQNEEQISVVFDQESGCKLAGQIGEKDLVQPGLMTTEGFIPSPEIGPMPTEEYENFVVFDIHQDRWIRHHSLP